MSETSGYAQEVLREGGRKGSGRNMAALIDSHHSPAHFLALSLFVALLCLVHFNYPNLTMGPCVSLGPSLWRKENGRGEAKQTEGASGRTEGQHQRQPTLAQPIYVNK